MTSILAVIGIILLTAVHWTGYLAGKKENLARIQTLEQQSAELCSRCGWRFFTPGVLGQGKDACYNCDCEKIAAYRQSDEFSNLVRK